MSKSIDQSPMAYDEVKELEKYTSSHLHFFMTDFERRACNLALMRDKAKHSDGAARMLTRWLARETPDVIAASDWGYTALWEKLRERVAQAVDNKELKINRCPSCNRIVRTPLARQCLWCGHDWH
jgi:hypothetical protein